MADRLEGWAYPLDQTILGYYIADHAFVKAPNNGSAYFNCWGGHSGAHQYRVEGGSGDGDYAVANCYRGIPVLGHTDTAYIEAYGLDGVCHKAANRFLYSANPWFGPAVVVTDPIHGVRGGIASVALFGVYGNTSCRLRTSWTTTRKLDESCRQVRPDRLQKLLFREYGSGSLTQLEEDLNHLRLERDLTLVRRDSIQIRINLSVGDAELRRQLILRFLNRSCLAGL